jgi:hypothetical protein
VWKWDPRSHRMTLLLRRRCQSMSSTSTTQYVVELKDAQHVSPPPPFLSLRASSCRTFPSPSGQHVKRSSRRLHGSPLGRVSANYSAWRKSRSSPYSLLPPTTSRGKTRLYSLSYNHILCSIRVRIII